MLKIAKFTTATVCRVECDRCGLAAEDGDGYTAWFHSAGEARSTAHRDEYSTLDDRDYCGGCTRDLIAIALGDNQSVYDAVWGLSSTATN